MINIKNSLLLLSISVFFINCNTKNYKDKIANKSNDTIQHSEKNKSEQNLVASIDTINNELLTSAKVVKPLNLYDFTFYLPNELEEWYSKNHDKDEMSKKWVIGQFYDQPTLKALKIGELLAHYNPEINNFVLQFKSTDGSIKKELTEIGDWGYGLHINVIEVTDKFVRIPNTYFNTTAWLRYGDNSSAELSKNKPIIYGNYATYVKQIVRLPRVSVTGIVNDKQTILEAGNYYIEKSSKEGFIIRQEIPEDMSCGEEINPKTDKKALKRYLLEINDLKDNKGSYQVKIAYPRGC